MTDRTIDWVFRATDKTGAAFRSIDSKLSGITKSLRTFAGFAGFAAVATGIGTLTRDLIQMGSELQDASEKLGVSAEALQSLKFAAEQTGASFDSLQAALVFNAKLTTAAVQGNKQATEAFRQLGIDAKKFADIPLDRRLAVIADQLAGIQNPGDRAALAVKALGRGAADLLPLLSQGSDGLAKFDRAARASNSILSNEQVKALDDAGDAWDAFILRLKVNAAPALTGTISLLEKMGKAAQDSANLTGLLFGAETEQMLRSAQGRDRGPGTRRAGRAAALSEEETAAIIGVPGKKSTAAALASFDKAFAEVDRIITKGTEAQRAALAERQRIQSEIDGITESTRTPQEAYFAGLDRVAELQANAGLSAEVASRQVLALGEAYATAQQQQYAGTETGRAYLQSVSDAAAIIESVITPFEAYGTALERINQLTAEGLLNQEQASRAVRLAGQDYADAQVAISKGNDELSESTQRLLKDIKTAADGFARDLTDVFFDSTKSIGEMFEELAKTIAKALFTQTVTEPLINSILGSFGGSGGLASLFGGGRAMGGSVSGRQAYLVGESGPELFVPGRSGAIVPNGAGSETPVQVNLTITSVDPQTAAQTIAAQERLITGMVRRATLRAGRRPALA